MSKRFDPLHALPHALWWQPGVYGSGPAVLLWIIARLPADLLTDVIGTPYASILLNHAGDTVFVVGWLASAAWLWFTRKRPEPTMAPARPPVVPDLTAPTQTSPTSRHGHGAG